MERDLKRILKAYEDVARLCIDNIKGHGCGSCPQCAIGRTMKALDLALEEG